MRSIRTWMLAIFAGAGTIAGAPARAEEIKLPPRVEEILGWMPEDTESLIVAQGPFRHDVGILGEALRDQVSCALRGKAALRGRAIALAVGAGRMRRLVEENQVVLQEGVNVVVFQEPLGAAGMAFRKEFLKDAQDDHEIRKSYEENFGKEFDGVESATTEKIAGHEVAVVRTRSQSGNSSAYVVQPAPEVLILASNRSYLEEVLGQMRRKGKTRALPASLPEWKRLDPTQPFWAIRHFSKEFPPQAAEVKFQISGYVFMYDPEKTHIAQLRWLSNDKDALQHAVANVQLQDENLRLEIQASAPSVVEATYRNPNAYNGCQTFLSYLMALFNTE